MMTDPIADMLTRIRNANRNSTKTVEMPASKMRVGIAEVLQSEGFVAGYRVEPGKPSSTLIVNLKYGVDGEQVIRAIENDPDLSPEDRARLIARIKAGQ